MKKFTGELDKIIKKYKLYVLKDVMYFIIITLVIHFAYRYWANSANYWPVESVMVKAHDKMADLVFNQSAWLIDHVLKIPVNTDGRTFYFRNNGFITINHGCSGLKPMLQFLLLMRTRLILDWLDI